MDEHPGGHAASPGRRLPCRCCLSLSSAARTAGVLLSLALASIPVQAQETRAEVIAQQQAKKAREVVRYEANRAEQIFERIETGGWLTGGSPRGFYPLFGSIYPGGGFSGGLGYRRFLGYESFVDVGGMYSMANYKWAEASITVPKLSRGRVDVLARAGWRDATQVPYFGLGLDTTRADRSAFRIQQGYVDGEVVLRPARRVALGGGIGYQDFREQAAQGRHPSIETLHDAVTAPRLGAEPAYVRAQASGAVLWLESPAYSREGGMARVTYQSFHPTRGGGSSFGLLRNEAVQHIPILRETWVLSLRARTESVTGDSESAPYFLLPYLGSGSTLRGYSTGRFRDRHAMLLTGEWRWIPNRLGLDMALFADAGNVASRFGDLTLSDMKVDYGIGIRFHTPTTTILRLELARGDEGWRTVFAAGAPF